MEQGTPGEVKEAEGLDSARFHEWPSGQAGGDTVWQGETKGSGTDLLAWAILGNRAQGDGAERKLEEKTEDCGDAGEAGAVFEAEAAKQKEQIGEGGSAAERAAGRRGQGAEGRGLGGGRSG